MNIPYDLKNPTKKYKLPGKYMEISGICPIRGSDSLAFVQDEAIRVYQFDLSSQEITGYVKHEFGDSEDIVILGNTAYILHAGRRPAIYKITGYNSGSAQCERYDLNLDKDYDPEGLCHDTNENRLLIACKSSPVKGDKVRKIFSFDTQSGTRASSPVFAIDSREILGGSGDTFNPSGIAIHPKSNDIYLIGTKDVKMIVCYGMNGVFKGAWELDKNQINQPEGIAFMGSGELIVSSEGEKGKKGKKGIKASIFMFSVEEQL
jgi:uncharacterized protein YjiK